MATKIEFTEEQGLLAQSARDFLAEHSTVEKVRAWMETPRGYDPKVYSGMADLGWMGVALPEAVGGAGLGTGALVVLAEAMGRRLTGSPWLASTLASQLILRGGSEAQQQKWLPDLATGSRIATVAWTEPNGSWRTEDLESTATPSDGGFTLTGTKTLVLDAQNADLVLWPAKVSGKLAVFAIEVANLPDGALRAEDMIDATRRSGRITLDGFFAAADSQLAGADPAAAHAWVERLGALLVAAEAGGSANSALELTIEYALTRKTWGQFIGKYQAVKHTLADVMVDIELTRSAVYYAGTVFEQDDDEAHQAVHMAKAQAGLACMFAGDRAVQFHGGMGFTWECDAQLYFRRAQWSEHTFGDQTYHRQAIGDRLLVA